MVALGKGFLSKWVLSPVFFIDPFNLGLALSMNQLQVRNYSYLYFYTILNIYNIILQVNINHFITTFAFHV